MKKPLKYLIQDTGDILAILVALALVVGLVWLLVTGVWWGIGSLVEA